MEVKIALAGNPNSGKTTLFNALTGSNQYVGNWPGVTVEKKEGRLKGNKEVVLIDLPGIYSLSPYTLEEVVSRNYLIDERPNAILNIVDGTNLERNLYLTTQLAELGIPMVIAINMMDVVKNNGDVIHTEKLSRELGFPVVEVSALKGSGIMEAASVAIEVAQKGKQHSGHSFSGPVEHALAHIEEAALHDFPEEQQRFFAVKLFERDRKMIQRLNLNEKQVAHIEQDIRRCEKMLDDDSESIITADRYTYIEKVVKECYRSKRRGKLTVSDKIDLVVTNRWLALPIFAIIMAIVFYVSVQTVGAVVTDWANDGVFGNGWHLAGIGAKEFETETGLYDVEQAKVEAFLSAAEDSGLDTSKVSAMLESGEIDQNSLAKFAEQANGINAVAEIKDETGETIETYPVDHKIFLTATAMVEPDPAAYGVWVPGVPVLIEGFLESVNCAPWLQSLIIDGIVAGVGGVLGFVPQIMILFLFLAFLEGCGYMSRVAFIMDRIFRKFGLSGKSFIPILIGVGCGVPGIMASRTIESDRDRKMTIITTTFIPCSAKLPIIALIAGALFEDVWWVGPSAYFIGIAAIICSGIILKKTKLFSGDVAPFVMELPAYHWPTISSLFRSMWERGWSFIKKAGTIILLSSIVIWFTSNFGFTDAGFGMVEMQDSLLAKLGSAIAWIFTPLGWGNWISAVAAITGLVAKENVVGTLGVLFGFAEVSESGYEMWSALTTSFTQVSAYSFLVFNLLCAPCFAAMGAIRREMNNRRWFWFAILYQCSFAYVVSLWIYQFGTLFTGGGFGVGTVAAILTLVIFVYLLVRKPPKSNAGAQTLTFQQG